MMRAVILSCTLMLLQLSVTAGNISVGESLTATATDQSAWVSPSADFAFGFHQFNVSDELFLLAIWYAKIPDTVVWYANEGYPVPQGSTLQLTADLGLVLLDPQGTHLWNTSQFGNGNRPVSYGLLNDTGNFALISSSNDVLWQSFDYPTDTLLPGQIMERSTVVTSRRTETNFTEGRFVLNFQADGNLVMTTREVQGGNLYPPYYAAGTWDGQNKTAKGSQVVYNESGYMYLLLKDGSMISLLSNPVSDRNYYQRATMDLDGMLSWYYHPRDTTGNGWKLLGMFPPYNICPRPPAAYGSGICGYNNICSLNYEGRPICQCPPNYTLLDPSDKLGSCVPDFVNGYCEGQGEGTVNGEQNLVQLLNTDWSLGDYAQLKNYDEDDCKTSCLNDCFCAAVVVDNTGVCMKMKFPLSHGYQNSSVQSTTWLKVGNSSILLNTNLLYFKRKESKDTVLTILLSSSVVANFFLLCAIGFGVHLICHKKGFRQLGVHQINVFSEYTNVTCFSYQELKKVTNDFMEEIGRGAFGIVYKGTIGRRGSQMHVAVKKLDRVSRDVNNEFETEVNVIGQTHHKNLVRLLGFCKEGDQRLLVYEYMRNGTLADYLFGDVRPSWSARIHVIQGVSRGLLYLHEECNSQIMHCDIKPQNILLDDSHNARISDFGLAKLLGVDQSETNTRIRGTKGYVAPDWFRNELVTVKVDVYSFGVLLLEIICCRKSLWLNANAEERIILTHWAFDCYECGKLDKLVNDDKEALHDKERLQRFVMVALWCIQEDPNLRPTMRMVTQMLEGLSRIPDLPCTSSFYSSSQRQHS